MPYTKTKSLLNNSTSINMLVALRDIEASNECIMAYLGISKRTYYLNKVELNKKIDDTYVLVIYKPDVFSDLRNKAEKIKQDYEMGRW